MRMLSFILLILLCTSCGTTKDMRRSNRAAKKLERLVEKYPELKRTDTILTPISIKTPEIKGRIQRPIQRPATPIDGKIVILPAEKIFIEKEIEPFTIPFEDEKMHALFSYNGTDFLLDYTIHSMQIDTIIQTEVKTIQPVVYENKPMTKLRWTLAILLGVVIGIVIVKITH